MASHVAPVSEKLPSLMDELFLKYDSDNESYFIEKISRFHSDKKKYFAAFKTFKAQRKSSAMEKIITRQTLAAFRVSEVWMMGR